MRSTIDKIIQAVHHLDALKPIQQSGKEKPLFAPFKIQPSPTPTTTMAQELPLNDGEVVKICHILHPMPTNSTTQTAIWITRSIVNVETGATLPGVNKVVDLGCPITLNCAKSSILHLTRKLVLFLFQFPS